jgi:predicted amidohydrolase YtcJ
VFSAIWFLTGTKNILSQDIFTIPKERLPATHSILTVVEGKIVYQSKDL